MLKQIGSRQILTPFSRTLYIFLIVLPLLGCNNEIPSRPLEVVSDFDADGISDASDLDDDNDGISDEIETTADLDGDEIGNYHDRDSDNDGIPDLIEVTGVDKDGDGTLDLWDEWEDENGNGFHDEYENEPLVEKTIQHGYTIWTSYRELSQISIDQDGDGIPNFWDLDSDNDGLTDKEEIGAASCNLRPFADTNADGFQDDLVGHVYTQGDNVDMSGHPEFVNLNHELYESSRPDGSFQSQNGEPDIDDDGDGMPDFLDKINDGKNFP